MRILSQSEFGSLHAQTQIPVDLAQQYFPVQLRAYSLKEGEIVGNRDRALESEDLGKILHRAAWLVDAGWVQIVDKISKDNHVYMKHVESKLTWDSFELGVGERQNSASTLVSLFPLSHLVHSEKLKEYEIEQRPGYIYFAAAIHNCSDWGSQNFRGSDIYGFPHWQYWQRQLREAEDRDSLTIQQTHHYDALPHAESTNDETTVWKSEVEDIAHCTNSRVVKSLSVEDGFHYILESPLEFPRGFVRETAMALKRDWHANSELIEKFCTLCFTRPAPPKGKLPKQDEPPFPHGESSLTGPDVWWRTSENPWIVQAILLARLIGGEFWQYALSNLEESSPQLLDLDLS